MASPECPFCGIPIEKPRELNLRRPQEMPLGSCSCGAVYAYDATGRNLGPAFIEALTFGCDMDWDLAWDLLPEEDYLEKLVKNYDGENHLLAPDGTHEGRRIPGALYFIRLHRSIQELTRPGVQEKLDRAAPVSPAPFPEWIKEKTFTKKDIEELVSGYQVETLLDIAARDKKIIRDLQRLLYSEDELFRSKTAEILGKVSAVIARRDPGTVSKFIQRLFTAFSDTGASSWGAIEAIGEIISNSPEILAGYAPALYQFLNDEMLRPKTLRALGEIAQARPDLLRQSSFRFLPFLQDAKPEARGYAAWLLGNLGNLGTAAAKADLERLRGDNQEIEFYKNGTISKKTVGHLALEALEKI